LGVRLVRICCGIVVRRIWWSMGLICGVCRLCWVMPILLLRRFIRMWLWGI
jgi:hypothetical protein